MPIAEKDILRMAQKIQQNESENNVYRKQLDKYFRGEMPSHEVINVCSTPNILKLLKSTAKKVVLNQKDLENAVADSKSGTKSHTEGHGISKEEIYKLSEALRNPIMVLKGNKRSQNSVILITDLTNKKGEKVFVPIALDRQNGRISTISSLYGKKNLSKYISEHTSDILAVNKEKVDLLADTRDQYSQSINDTVTYFDDSIAYTTDNVKYPSEKSPEQQAKQQEEQQAEQPDNIKSRNAEYQIHNSTLAHRVQKIELAIVVLEDKINDLENKIRNNETKIATQKSKIEDSQNTIRYYKAILETTALSKPLQVFVSSMIDRQNTKIANCNAKIKKLEERCGYLSDKISENNQKIESQTSRIKVFQKIDTFLVNMQSKEGRRENFVQAINDLRNWSLERNKDKAAKLKTKFSQKDVALSKATTASERVALRNQLAKLAEKKQKVEDKIEQLTAMTDKLNQLCSMSEQQADRVIVAATESIQTSISESSDVSVTKVVDTVLTETDKSLDNIINIVNRAAETAVDDVDQQAAKLQKLAITSLCSTIEETFNENYTPDRNILHTSVVMDTLSAKCDFDDVKSVVAVVIINRQDEIEKGNISPTAVQWANKQSVSENIKPLVADISDLLSNVKSGFFDVFAKKVGTWEHLKQNENRENSVINRDKIAKKSTQQHTTQKQDKDKKLNKNGQAL